ncbi:ABC transporter ATP-binding protein [Haliangium ochraceum]|uniref:ABC transporter related protein n=1 Tax=Haliangium ochraceum (strain DSM 14365 / JCM 11303 / SMP-2) TaxID=502025 RepID=D0LSE6_HALO1|nr:sn-glycerol-3-phosphate ABC transporter ATP-binding protein UgpC [Haliangium ochraceum]ACY15645.1 ABC transporter related protein [Haliangium ochraceum DSM 14365]
MASIKMRNVHKRFGNTHVIKGVDLDIEDGDFCVFVGPSGCGKSTMLRLIAGLEDISSGDLFIGEKKVNTVAPSRRGVAIVFQSYALYPHMNVYDNMAFGLKLSRQGKDEIKQRVEEAAKILQIDHLLHRLPKELSGGQRQRVAIGRAITRQPQVFLFDEPLSNLDAALRVQTRLELAKLHERLGTTMVYVTHDQVEAMTLADKIVILNAGHVAQVGAPLELYHFPDNLFVAGFIGSPKMNFIPCIVDEADADGAAITLSDGTRMRVPVDAARAKKGDSATLGIRPEHLELLGAEAEADNALAGEVQIVEHLGEGSFIYVKTSVHEQNLTIKEEGDTAASSGSSLRMRLPPESCHLFDRDEQAFPRLHKASKLAELKIER